MVALFMRHFLSRWGWRRLPADGSQQIGQSGERLACRYLVRSGYRLVVTNLKLRLGRSLRGQPLTGEIDIVAYDGPILCFVEVKTRTTTGYLPPERAVDRQKQRQLSRTAHRYRQLLHLTNEPYRFDVVTVILSTTTEPEIELHRGYFKDQTEHKRSFAWYRSPVDGDWT